MFYNRILRIWVVDEIDYFLFSALLGSLLARFLKNYLSEEKTMERLKNSIIQKSRFKSKKPILSPKEIRSQKIIRIALGLENRGGQFENFQADNKTLRLAQMIKIVVERLAKFLKQRELKGVARLFFKNGRLVLELILYRCKVDVMYALIEQGLDCQVIVLSATTGGITGFIISWYAVGASLVIPPLLVSLLLVRGTAQQVINQINYSIFKKMLERILENDELRETVRTVFMEGEIPRSPFSIEMKPLDLEKNPLPEFKFKADKTLDEFIKERLKDELGLIENPTYDQLKEIITPKKNKRRGKTVYFRDFIDKIAVDENIIDAEILPEPIRVRIKNDQP